jgi:hypothetical protein
MPYAIYYEHWNAFDVRQKLFIPGLTQGSTSFFPVLAHRELTPAFPSRVWTFSTNSDYARRKDALDTHDKLLGREVEQLSKLSHTLLAEMSNTAWELEGSIVIPLTDSDVADLFGPKTTAKMRLPIAVQARIPEERNKLGFPALPGKQS